MNATFSTTTPVLSDHILSPVSLSYAAALRNVSPRQPKTAFAYAQVGCSNISSVLCMAACNPEGRFFVILTDANLVTELQKQAMQRRVENISFIVDTSILRDLNYLVYDALSEGEGVVSRAAFAELASRTLLPNGLATHRYAAYPNADESLRFVVSEFAPEMNVEQAAEFLQELKDLGQDYFASHPIAASALEKAMTQNIPDEFFATCDTGTKAISGTFDVMAAFLPKDFVYVGDADVRYNYLELSAPASSHALLEECATNLMYEPIKDFATQRMTRCDIWCRRTVDVTDDLVTLYNGFTFGLTKPLDMLPDSIFVGGQTVDLTEAPYKALLDLMEMMPICIGDFLAHDTGRDTRPADVVTALHIMVALGVISPMRSSYLGKIKAEVMHPKMASSFNDYLSDKPITTSEINFASAVVGHPLILSAKDALVLQAINRAGLEDSVSALLPELERVANDPMLAARIMDTAVPTAEQAHDMITSVVDKSMLRWYAYGLLAA